jgi:hypothetical protein
MLRTKLSGYVLLQCRNRSLASRLRSKISMAASGALIQDARGGEGEGAGFTASYLLLPAVLAMRSREAASALPCRDFSNTPPHSS